MFCCFEEKFILAFRPPVSVGDRTQMKLPLRKHVTPISRESLGTNSVTLLTVLTVLTRLLTPLLTLLLTVLTVLTKIINRY